MGFFTTIALCFFLVILVFSIYRLIHKNKINVEYNSSGQIAKYITKMKSLQRSYSPTPWLLNCHFQTVWGMRYRKKPRFTPRRETFIFEDQGNAVLDWFEDETMNENTPIVVISHTLAGGTREPVIANFAMSCLRHGWRAVVANHRGCSGAKITSSRIYNAIQIDDLHNIVLHCHEEFKPKNLFIAGFSLGALQSLQYSAKLADPKIVQGICVVSHIYDSYPASVHLSDWPQIKLYTPIIMIKLKHMLDKAGEYLDHKELIEPARKTRTMDEFDDVFTAKYLGLKDNKEYYSKSACYQYIPIVKVPTLILGADDDPFTYKRLLPITDCRNSENVALVHTAEGGHVSFISGLNGDKSLIDSVLPDFINAIITA